ncbi:MAG: hypothetical protein ACR2QW_17795 [bacterium]
MTKAGDQALDVNISVAKIRGRDLGLELGADPSRTRCQRMIRNILIANLISLFWMKPTGFLYYSRDNNYYARTRRYHCRCFSANNVIWAVQSLDDAGLINHHQTRPSPEAWFRSTVRLQHDISNQLKINKINAFDFRILEPIVLKDRVKQPMSYRTTRHILALREDVCAHNELLEQTDIILRHESWITDQYGFLRRKRQVINPARKYLYRVYNNGSFKQGGRFYGPFWHQLSKRIRAHLLINGDSVIERDFQACHPRLMYSLMGKTMPEFDPYDIEGFDRATAKTGFQKLVNSSNRKSAVLAIAEPYSRKGMRGAHQVASQMIDAFEAKHPDIRSLFYSGMGLRLQNLDSQICSEVQGELRELGIPVLSIHDSFIVSTTARVELDARMNDSFDRTCRRLKT